MIPAINLDDPVPLPGLGSWPESVHLFDEPTWTAIRAAVAARRPLLIRGEPGAGKSQIARAAAAKLNRLFLSDVVHSRTEAQDLMWRFDTVARLGEAQVLGAAGVRREAARRELNPLKYVIPGPLWFAFNYTSAVQQLGRAKQQSGAPARPAGWDETAGDAVLLIDEIDKAESDVPNALLEVLANGAFPVPWRTEPVKPLKGKHPLVVITTNDERELPVAFVRRCIVLNLDLPDSENEFCNLLAERGRKHFGATVDSGLYLDAAAWLWRDRQKAPTLGIPKAGQAEYFDLLRAVKELEPDCSKQPELAGVLRKYTLEKHQRPKE